jgi:hypothetical protein
LAELAQKTKELSDISTKQQLSLKKAMALNENLPIQLINHKLKVESQH